MNAGRVAALGFLAFSAALAAAAWALPAGVGAVPGPAFFPLGIAAVMAALSVARLFQAEPVRESPAGPPGGARRVAVVTALLFVHVLLWGTGLFALRTAVFLCLMLRWTGQPWRTSAAVAAALTGVVVLAFQVGLKVSLD